MLRDRNLPGETFLTELARAVTPVLDSIKSRIDANIGRTPPKSRLGIALHYALSQWENLENYLLDARLRPDNNIAKNAIHPFTLGRKNWLFSGSPAGAEASSLFYSLIETAKANKLNPNEHLLYLFEKLPTTPDAQLDSLLPWRYALHDRR